MRFADWESRLGGYLRSCRGVPFAWGSHDCCTFAAGAVLAMTGEDRMEEFRGRYGTARGSVVALRKYGAGTLASTLDGKFEAIEPGFAQRGDLVLCDDGHGGAALGLCFGDFAICIGSEGQHEGLIRIERVRDGVAQWRRGWKID